MRTRSRSSWRRGAGRRTEAGFWNRRASDISAHNVYYVKSSRLQTAPVLAVETRLACQRSNLSVVTSPTEAANGQDDLLPLVGRQQSLDLVQRDLLMAPNAGRRAQFRALPSTLGCVRERLHPTRARPVASWRRTS